MSEYSLTKLVSRGTSEARNFHVTLPWRHGVSLCP